MALGRAFLHLRKRIVSLAPAGLLASACTTKREAETASADAGWRVLFDGKTSHGWRGLGRDSVPLGHGNIEDGTIQKVPSGEVPTAPDGRLKRLVPN